METSIDDEISLVDIYEFLVGEWKIILSIAFIGTCVGVVTSLAIPDQFEAKGLIQGAKVASMDSMQSADVEPAAVLVEKMRSSTYYDSKTLVECANEGGASNSQALTKALNVNVAKNTDFVSVSYRAESKDKATRCLEQVLVLVVERQEALKEEGLFSLMSNLDNAKKKSDELRKLVKQMDIDIDSLVEFKSVEHVATVLIAGIFRSNVQTELSDIEKEISKMEAMLRPPNTQQAKFVTPVFASEQSVSPRRGRIVLISAMAGLFFGLLMALLKVTFAGVKKRRGERFKSASITP